MRRQHEPETRHRHKLKVRDNIIYCRQRRLHPYTDYWWDRFNDAMLDGRVNLNAQRPVRLILGGARLDSLYQENLVELAAAERLSEAFEENDISYDG